MTENDKIIRAVLEAIDELNEQLPKEKKLEKSLDTSLFGSGGSLDSLSMVSLVTSVEQKIEENFGITATLLEDIADLENDNPFETVMSLADYVASILEKSTIE
jgi:acyl carrier protein